MSLGDGDLNLPYEDVPDGPIDQHVTGFLASAVVVSALQVNIDDELHPAVMFKFALGDGRFADPVILVVSKDELRALVPLVKKSVQAALKASQS